MKFYAEGRAGADFETGIRTALQAMLVSLHLPVPVRARAGHGAGRRELQGERHRAGRRASRYFLWSRPPDAVLGQVSRAGRLHEPAVLNAQARRMLHDPRSFALSTRFAAQWLRLQDVDKVHPDALQYPIYDATVADSMKRETELFFDSIVIEGTGMFWICSTADYTYVNQPLAAFYGIPNVAGPEFRKVSLAGTPRRGLLGQGEHPRGDLGGGSDSISVLGGKWVLEVLLGQPPPPPPPNVPPLDATGAVSKDGKPLSVRQRMEAHRANPFCASCHSMIDPIGLALENFDPTGHWRIRDNGADVDASTTLYDGTKMNGLEGLDQALLKHQDTFLRVFTENLMAYALGRQVRVLRHADGPGDPAATRRVPTTGSPRSSWASSTAMPSG